MEIQKLIHQLALVLEMVGVEASLQLNCLMMIGNLQTLGVPIHLTSIPGTVAASFGVFFLPALGVLVKRCASSKSGKAKILLATSSLSMIGLVLIMLGNTLVILEPLNDKDVLLFTNETLMDLNSTSSTTHNSLTTTLNGSGLTELHQDPQLYSGGISVAAAITMIGYICVDSGYDSTNCFLKTFSMACVLPKDQPGIIIKQVLLSTFGGYQSIAYIVYFGP